MKFTPSSTARRKTASAPARSFGGPQIPAPVRRIAPYPRRFTVNSPPRVTVPPDFNELFALTDPPPVKRINEELKECCIFVPPWLQSSLLKSRIQNTI